MHANDVIIEITRKCNMKCPHCLRGNAENKNIDIESVRNLFRTIDYISTLTITGGEPSLQPKLISKIVDVAREENVEIDSFYMVTNAKKVTPLFITAIHDLYNYCSENEISQVHISNDGYHDDLLLSNVERLENEFEYIKDGECLVSFKNRKTGEKYNALYEGNAVDVENGVSCNAEVKFHKFDINDYDGDISIDGDAMIYLNALGDIIPECNLSYDSQREDNIKLGNINDDNFMLLEALQGYNNLFPIDEDYPSMDKSELLEMELV
jgi:MoaA/NifB/PqqE/SkfB family radical SAM enzyme